MVKYYITQNKYTRTDPVFTLHGLPSRSNCYIKALKCALTIQVMYCTGGWWWKCGEVAISRLCVVFTPQNRQQMSPLRSVFKYVAVLTSPCISMWLGRRGRRNGLQTVTETGSNTAEQQGGAKYDMSRKHLNYRTSREHYCLFNQDYFNLTAAVDISNRFINISCLSLYGSTEHSALCSQN